MSLRYKLDKKSFILLFKGAALLRVHVPTFKAFIKSLKIKSSDDLQPSKIKKKTKKVIVDNTDSKVKQFANMWTKARKKYYGIKAQAIINLSVKDKANIAVALELMSRHNIKFRTFINSQIEGLKFVNGGKGVFPSYAQLASSAAENRLIEFIAKDRSIVVETKLTAVEKDTPLKENKLYMERIDKVMKGTASYWEAVYVENCILARRGPDEYPPDVKVKVSRIKRAHKKNTKGN